MTYNPDIHHRRSIRLKEYDYSQAGAYFITICTDNRAMLFGEIIAGEMKLNEIGQIARNQWIQIPGRFENIELDEFIIMPNHVHGIVLITRPHPVGEGRGRVYPCPERNRVPLAIAPEEIGQPQGLPLQESPAYTIGRIVGAYKSIVAKDCLKIYKSKNEIMGKLWQRNYYEHIIRNEKSYGQIVDYIINNPAEWEKDQLYSEKKH